MKLTYFHHRGSIYLSWNNERDRFNSRCRHLVGSSDLALGHLQGATRKETHSTLRIRRLVFGKGEKGVGFVLVVPNISISVHNLSDGEKTGGNEKWKHPLPARNRIPLSLQKGITTPAVWSRVIILALLRLPASQIPTCRSLILLKPVVAKESFSPIQTTRAPLMPPCPSVMRTGSPPARGSNKRIFLSLQVVIRTLPTGLNVRLWIASPWPPRVDFGDSGLPRSQSLTT